MNKIVIIPAYNEEGSIVKTVSDIRKNAPDFDYLIINDCSVDKTREICINNNLNFIDLPVNLGIGGAVQTGYIYAYRKGYDLAVQFDGDGQHRAEYLEDMANVIVKEHADMVIGSRFINKEGFQSSGIRRIGIRYFTLAIKILTGVIITDATSGMRMVNTDVLKIFNESYPKDYPEPESLVSILSKNKKVIEVPVIMNEREEGVSSISPIKSVYYMIKVSIAIFIAKFGK